MCTCGPYTTQPALTCFNSYTNDCCPPQPLIKKDSSKPCTRYRTEYIDCDGDGFPECPNDVVYTSDSCPGYVATPTPTPTPAPTPVNCIPGVCMDDSPTTVQVDECNSSYSAGCPSGYTRSGNCCYPPCPVPTPTPPPCARGFLIRPTRLTFCNWICIMPTVQPGGGGNADPSGDDMAIITGCTNYYWVWYESDDDGETWYATGEVDYAGCW